MLVRSPCLTSCKGGKSTYTINAKKMNKSDLYDSQCNINSSLNCITLLMQFGNLIT